MKAAITKISLEPSLSACIMKQDEEGVWGVGGGCGGVVWRVCGVCVSECCAGFSARQTRAFLTTILVAPSRN